MIESLIPHRIVGNFNDEELSLLLDVKIIPHYICLIHTGKSHVIHIDYDVKTQQWILYDSHMLHGKTLNKPIHLTFVSKLELIKKLKISLTSTIRYIDYFKTSIEQEEKQIEPFPLLDKLINENPCGLLMNNVCSLSEYAPWQFAKILNCIAESKQINQFNQLTDEILREPNVASISTTGLPCKPPICLRIVCENTPHLLPLLFKIMSQSDDGYHKLATSLAAETDLDKSTTWHQLALKAIIPIALQHIKKCKMAQT